MITSEIQATVASSAATAALPAAVPSHRFSFHEFLSDINPLQYLPVIGTIYRTVTGDVIPEALREAGSFLVSGLLGGPIGLITSIAVTIAEKIIGIDPEKIVASVFHTAPPAAAAPADPPAADPVVASVVADPVKASSAAAPRIALTPEQLAAYGIHSDASVAPKLAEAGAADALNSIELTRLRHAAAAYAANQPRVSTAARTGG